MIPADTGHSALTLGQRAGRKLPRVVKYGRQWMRVPWRGRRPTTRVVFVVGAARSGTRVPLHVLDQHPDVISYTEGSDPFFERVLLKPLPRVEQLVGQSPFPMLVLKPICETHRFEELLDRFPDSRCIWIFRHYADTARSASLKWSNGIAQIHRLAEGDLVGSGWRGGGLTKTKLAEIRRLYHDGISLLAANALFWYVRTGLFFDLGADHHRDVLLVRYEDLVSKPDSYARRLFEFLGLDMPPRMERVVYRSSVFQEPNPAIPAPIRDVCEELLSRLVAHTREPLHRGRPRC